MWALNLKHQVLAETRISAATQDLACEIPSLTMQHLAWEPEFLLKILVEIACILIKTTSARAEDMFCKAEEACHL